MLILNYPTFAQKVPIGSTRPDGTMSLWFVTSNQLLQAAMGLAAVGTLFTLHNEARSKLGLRLETKEMLQRRIRTNLGRNKTAVAVLIEDDELVYLYNHDGTLYLACQEAI